MGVEMVGRRRGRAACGLGIVLLLVLSLLQASASGAAETNPRLEAPTGLVVAPGVGAVTISWQALSLTGVTYIVRSSPSGLTCAVVDETSCTLTDRSSTPFSFSVIATKNGSRNSVPSPSSAPLRTHLVLVVVGQSNATGWQSFVTDPITGIDYLAAPYTNGADSHDLITWEPWWVYPAPGTGPVALDTPQVCSIGPVNTVFGPEIGLARQLWTDTGRSATIVKATYAGSDLASNWGPSLHGGLFDSTVSDVTGLMATDAAAGQFDVLGGFFSVMGESDAAFPDTAAAYHQNLKQFVLALRAQLPMANTAPIVLSNEDISAYLVYLEAQGELTATQVSLLQAQNATVRAANDWAASRLHDVFVVDTSQLARFNPPLVHLTNVSELTLGGEMAKVAEPQIP
jgi:hypothetical protein